MKRHLLWSKYQKWFKFFRCKTPTFTLFTVAVWILAGFFPWNWWIKDLFRCHQEIHRRLQTLWMIVEKNLWVWAAETVLMWRPQRHQAAHVSSFSPGDMRHVVKSSHQPHNWWLFCQLWPSAWWRCQLQPMETDLMDSWLHPRGPTNTWTRTLKPLRRCRERVYVYTRWLSIHWSSQSHWVHSRIPELNLKCPIQIFQLWTKWNAANTVG